MAAVATRQPRDILVTDVIYREDLDPRSLTNPERVQEYAGILTHGIQRTKSRFSVVLWGTLSL